MMNNSDEIINSALFCFYGFGCTPIRTKTILKMWFTWETKISIKIYFLVILWSVTILKRRNYFQAIIQISKTRNTIGHISITKNQILEYKLSKLNLANDKSTKLRFIYFIFHPMYHILQDLYFIVIKIIVCGDIWLGHVLIIVEKLV